MMTKLFVTVMEDKKKRECDLQMVMFFRSSCMTITLGYLHYFRHLTPSVHQHDVYPTSRPHLILSKFLPPNSSFPVFPLSNSYFTQFPNYYSQNTSHSPSKKNLQWLPIIPRTKYKIFSLAFKDLHNVAPALPVLLDITRLYKYVISLFPHTLHSHQTDSLTIPCV